MAKGDKSQFEVIRTFEKLSKAVSYSDYAPDKIETVAGPLDSCRMVILTCGFQHNAYIEAFSCWKGNQRLWRKALDHRRDTLSLSPSSCHGNQRLWRKAFDHRRDTLSLSPSSCLPAKFFEALINSLSAIAS